NYRRALLGLSRGEPLASAGARLETALAGGDFNLYRADDAKLLYASVRARTRHPSDALRIVSSLPASAEALYVETVARLALGDDYGAGAAVIASLGRYPADPRPLLAWLGAKERPSRSMGSAAVVAAGFAAADALKELDRNVLVALAPYAGSLDESRLLLREFRAAGGRSAAATVLALRYGLLGEERAVREMLSGDYEPTTGSLRSLYALLSSDAARASLADAFSAFSGSILQDDDVDGIPEAIARYEEGSLASWALDADQDGLPETEAAFLDGAPRRLSVTMGSTTLTLGYAPWPRVETAEFADAKGYRRYSLGPSFVSDPALSLRPLFGSSAAAPRFPERGSFPTEAGVASAAYGVERDEGGVFERAELSGGERAMSRWSDDFGARGRTVFASGVPADDRIDFDGDGRLEARRYWARGPEGLAVPSWIEADLDGDGRYEYREGLRPPYLKSWDYDGDGSVDMTLESAGDGGSVYRFPSRAGLGSGTTVRYAGGRLLSVAEDGSEIVPQPDSGGAVYWIGEKPFDFGAAAPKPGYGTRNGASYRVIELGGVLYACILYR
ncbi:MAG: hypothetical protein KKB59_03920, partial [Spirochaetes bacterium]|nr:hypothetical protein [Spirochaetota bacterium]